MPKMVNNKNYKKAENQGGKNQTQTKRQEGKKLYTNTKYTEKTSLLLFA